MHERNSNQIIEQHDTMQILRNDFPYFHWDDFEVADHLMIMPIRHIGSLADFNKIEANDFFDVLQEYEAKHYSVYSRAPSNTSRTQVHLHTHLIKPTGF